MIPRNSLTVERNVLRSMKQCTTPGGWLDSKINEFPSYLGLGPQIHEVFQLVDTTRSGSGSFSWNFIKTSPRWSPKSCVSRSCWCRSSASAEVLRHCGCWADGRRHRDGLRWSWHEGMEGSTDGWKVVLYQLNYEWACIGHVWVYSAIIIFNVLVEEVPNW